MNRKKLISLLIALAVCVVQFAAADGLFPSANVIFGEIMPSVSLALGRAADNEDGTEFSSVTEDEYTKLGKYLAGAGCVLDNTQVNDGEVIFTVSKNGTSMTIKYNPGTKNLSAAYADGSRVESTASDPAERSLFPELTSIFSVAMPSFRRSALANPTEEITLEDGSRQLTFENITEEVFNKYSVYLSEYGCVLAGYSVDGMVMTATVTKDGASFTFVYDYATLKAVVIYPAGTNEEKVDIKEAKRAPLIGSYVTYGHYPQTSSGTDNTPIECLVLDVQNDKALLISRYGLDAQPYNKDWVNITWEKCTLRTWLNGTFMNKAFSAEEQKAILTTTVDNSQSQCYSGWSTSGGNNTQDKIFLLSYAEANKYFGVTYEDSKNTKSRVEPTAFAIKNGAYTSSSYTTADGKAAGWWWLRSPGYYQSRAAFVYYAGSLFDRSVDRVLGCVRPAFWINLESEIF